MTKVQLIVVQGKPEGKVIPLGVPLFRIGRDPACHLRPSHEMVSRLHAEIRVTGNEVTIKDLGSRNGTFLNGRTINQNMTLKSGDLVKVGPLTFAVSIEGAPAEAAPRAAAPVKSLDEVGQEEVEAWLITDREREVPDRPSGVYDGDTMTLGTYKSIRSSDDAIKAAAAKPAPTATPTAAKPAQAPAKPDPAPQPVVQAPSPAPTPAPPTPPPAPVAPPQAPAAATAAPEPASPRPPQRPREPVLDTAAPDRPKRAGDSAAYRFMDVIENLEYLSEGTGDAESEPAQTAGEATGQTAAGASDESTEEQPSDEIPEEFMDESNPFYVAKKKPDAAEGAAEKHDFKDSADAANAILKKMLERRRNR